jgi:hypothetical protein
MKFIGMVILLVLFVGCRDGDCAGADSSIPNNNNRDVAFSILCAIIKDNKRACVVSLVRVRVLHLVLLLLDYYDDSLLLHPRMRMMMTTPQQHYHE